MMGVKCEKMINKEKRKEKEVIAIQRNEFKLK
jgi:hypothetical protein